jgi:hypothetical protein
MKKISELKLNDVVGKTTVREILLWLLANEDLIISATCDCPHVVFTLTDREPEKVEGRMMDVMRLLNRKKFFRSHTSHIIAWKHVRFYWQNHNGQMLAMVNQTLIPVAPGSRNDAFLNVILTKRHIGCLQNDVEYRRLAMKTS